MAISNNFGASHPVVKGSTTTGTQVAWKLDTKGPVPEEQRTYALPGQTTAGPGVRPFQSLPQSGGVYTFGVELPDGRVVYSEPGKEDIVISNNAAGQMTGIVFTGRSGQQPIGVDFQTGNLIENPQNAFTPDQSSVTSSSLTP
jgi:hypothetical protein